MVILCTSNLLERDRNYGNKLLLPKKFRNRVHLRKSHEDPPDTLVLPTTRTVEPPVKTTSPSTSLRSTELEHCIPTHSTPQHEAQSPSASDMRTDTHQTSTLSDIGYTTRSGRQVKLHRVISEMCNIC